MRKTSPLVTNLTFRYFPLSSLTHCLFAFSLHRVFITIFVPNHPSSAFVAPRLAWSAIELASILILPILTLQKKSTKSPVIAFGEANFNRSASINFQNPNRRILALISVSRALRLTRRSRLTAASLHSRWSLVQKGSKYFIASSDAL